MDKTGDAQLKGFGTGALQGASAGAMFGPWGAAIGGVGGGLMGLMSADSGPDYQPMYDESKKWAGQYGDWRDNVKKIPGQVTSSDSYKDRSQLYLGEANQAAGQASAAGAGATDRRGISDSGYALGGQGDVLSKMALARMKARQGAYDDTFRDLTTTAGMDLQGLNSETSVAMHPYDVEFGFQGASALQGQQIGANQQDQLLPAISALAFGNKKNGLQSSDDYGGAGIQSPTMF